MPAARCPVIPAGAKRRAGTHAWVRLRMGPDSVAIRFALGSRVRGNDGVVWAWVPAFAGMTGWECRPVVIPSHRPLDIPSFRPERSGEPEPMRGSDYGWDRIRWQYVSPWIPLVSYCYCTEVGCLGTVLGCRN